MRLRTMLPRLDATASVNHKPWDGESAVPHDPTPPVPWEPVRSQAQVAERLGVSRGTVFNDERSAMAKLRAALSDLAP